MSPMLMEVDYAQRIIYILHTSCYTKMFFNHFIFQGLSDTEEFVVSEALNAPTCLAELRLLKKPALQELVSEIALFLCHPVSVNIYNSTV